MVPRNVSRNTLEFEDHFAILPAFRDWDSDAYQKEKGGTWCEDQFKYSSDNNERWLTADEIREMIGPEKVAIEEWKKRADERATEQQA